MAEYITENDLNEYVKSSELNTSEIFKIKAYDSTTLNGGGLVIKFGNSYVFTDTEETQTFTYSFPNKIHGVWITPQSSNNIPVYPILLSADTNGFKFKIINKSGATSTLGNCNIFWLAIGV